MNIQEEFEGEFYDTSLDPYPTYEDYLRAHVTDQDRFYLEDEDLACQLVELGFHAKNEILPREVFF